MRSVPLPWTGLLVTAAMILASVPEVRAAQISWRKDFSKAAREAARSGKPMLVGITASWCHFCRKMATETFADQQVARHINTCFVPVRVDADRQQRIVEAIGIDGLPTTVIVSPEMRIVKKISGFRTTTQLSKQLNPVCQAGHEVPATPKPQQARTADTPSAGPPRPAKIAFGGCCLVSTHKEQSLVRGSRQITATYKGTSVCFASEAARRKFQADPQKYWPAWDGYCPVSLVDDGKKRRGKLQFGALYRGRLWLLADEEHYQQFAAHPKRYLPEHVARRRNGSE